MKEEIITSTIEFQSNTANMLQPSSLLLGRYRILRKLGNGGMGAVYEATDERFATPIALKEIIFKASDEKQRSNLSAAFEREAKSLARIQHECVPFFRDYFSENNREYLVMELIEGDDLGTILEEQKNPFTLQEVVDYMRQLLDALDYLHGLSTPIIHRDIKPQNLKLTARKRLKLLDFGIAKSGASSARTTLDHTFVAATIDYSPVEQLLRVVDSAFREYVLLKHETQARKMLEQQTDGRADIFAVGATFYHLLTNVPPTNATRRALTVWKGSKDPLPHPSDLLSDIPRALGDFLLKAMAIDRSDRFASAEEMLEALNKISIANISSAPHTAVRTMISNHSATTLPNESYHFSGEIPNAASEEPSLVNNEPLSTESVLSEIDPVKPPPKTGPQLMAGDPTPPDFSKFRGPVSARWFTGKWKIPAVGMVFVLLVSLASTGVCMVWFGRLLGPSVTKFADVLASPLSEDSVPIPVEAFATENIGTEATQAILISFKTHLVQTGLQAWQPAHDRAR